MNSFSQSLDRYLTTNPNENLDNFIDLVIESVSDKFYDENEEWLMESPEGNVFENWCVYLSNKEYSPVISASIIQRAFSLYLKQRNPILNNRIVSDITFARRLRSHLKSVKSNCMMGQEEIDYLSSVAEKLLKHQISTCPAEEKWYHDQLKDK